MLGIIVTPTGGIFEKTNMKGRGLFAAPICQIQSSEFRYNFTGRICKTDAKISKIYFM